MNKVSIKIPASTANVGPGYDVFGLALSLYNTISIEKSDAFEINITGPKADNSVPADENNLVWKSIQEFYKHINKECPLLKVTINCEIPLSSGLGSSSTAIAGGIAAANRLEGNPLNTNDLITLAWKIEGHPDNTTPAILGGFIISTIKEDQTIAYQKINWPDNWKIIICHPDFKLSTQKARAVIPKSIPLSDAIYNIGRGSFLVAAICLKDKEAMKIALKDKLHQQYRKDLVPGLTEILSTLENHNILGAVLSGAGPSICIITDSPNHDDIVKTVKEIWLKEQLNSEFFFPEVDNHGIHYTCE